MPLSTRALDLTAQVACRQDQRVAAMPLWTIRRLLARQMANSYCRSDKVRERVEGKMVQMNVTVSA